jgi:hypothetical protein
MGLFGVRSKILLQIQILLPVLERVQTVHCLRKGSLQIYVVQSAQCCCVWNRRSSH